VGGDMIATALVAAIKVVSCATYRKLVVNA
jgi:hypothetical protein